MALLSNFLLGGMELAASPARALRERLLGPNQPGLDWGDVAEATVLDPTMLVGGGLAAALGGRAARRAARRAALLKTIDARVMPAGRYAGTIAKDPLSQVVSQGALQDLLQRQLPLGEIGENISLSRSPGRINPQMTAAAVDPAVPFLHPQAMGPAPAAGAPVLPGMMRTNISMPSPEYMSELGVTPMGSAAGYSRATRAAALDAPETAVEFLADIRSPLDSNDPRLLQVVAGAREALAERHGAAALGPESAYAGQLQRLLGRLDNPAATLQGEELKLAMEMLSREFPDRAPTAPPEMVRMTGGQYRPVPPPGAARAFHPNPRLVHEAGVAPILPGQAGVPEPVYKSELAKQMYTPVRPRKKPETAGTFDPETTVPSPRGRIKPDVKMEKAVGIHNKKFISAGDLRDTQFNLASSGERTGHIIDQGTHPKVVPGAIWEWPGDGGRPGILLRVKSRTTVGTVADLKNLSADQKQELARKLGRRLSGETLQYEWGSAKNKIKELVEFEVISKEELYQAGVGTPTLRAAGKTTEELKQEVQRILNVAQGAEERRRWSERLRKLGMPEELAPTGASIDQPTGGYTPLAERISERQDIAARAPVSKTAKEVQAIKQARGHKTAQPSAIRQSGVVQRSAYQDATTEALEATVYDRRHEVQLAEQTLKEASPGKATKVAQEHLNEMRQELAKAEKTLAKRQKAEARTPEVELAEYTTAGKTKTGKVLGTKMVRRKAITEDDIARIKDLAGKNLPEARQASAEIIDGLEADVEKWQQRLSDVLAQEKPDRKLITELKGQVRTKKRQLLQVRSLLTGIESHAAEAATTAARVAPAEAHVAPHLRSLQAQQKREILRRVSPQIKKQVQTRLRQIERNRSAYSVEAMRYIQEKLNTMGYDAIRHQGKLIPLSREQLYSPVRLSKDPLQDILAAAAPLTLPTGSKIAQLLGLNDEVA